MCKFIKDKKSRLIIECRQTGGSEAKVWSDGKARSLAGSKWAGGLGGQVWRVAGRRQRAGLLAVCRQSVLCTALPPARTPSNHTYM